MARPPPATALLFLLVHHYGGRQRGSGVSQTHGGGISRSQQRKVLRAQFGQQRFLGKLAQDLTIERHRFVGLTQLAVAFAQPKQRRRRQPSIALERLDQRFVGGDRRWNVAIPFFLEQPPLEQGRKVVGHCGNRLAEPNQQDREQGRRNRSHRAQYAWED